MDRRHFLTNTATALTTIALSQINHTALSSNKILKPTKMRIVVLTGSPRKNGNSNYLAEQFIKGAKETGHDIFRFDCAFKRVEPCRACNRCGMNGTCIYDDDFLELRPHLINADMVVFASPIKTGNRPFLCYQRTNQRALQKSCLSDDLRRHRTRRSGANPPTLPYFNELFRMGKRRRSRCSRCMDCRFCKEHILP